VAACIHVIAVELGVAVARTPASHASRPLGRLAVLRAWMDVGSKSQHQHVYADRHGHGRRLRVQRSSNPIPADLSRVVSHHG
jgi:hypothetical protein